MSMDRADDVPADAPPSADADPRRALAGRMVRILPAFGQWALAVRDFQTPYGKIGLRQATILYELRHRMIGDGPTTPSAMAEHYGVQPSVITRVLTRLEAGGFITRHPDPTDGRSQRIEITDAGVTISVHIEGLFVASMLDSLTRALVEDTPAGIGDADALAADLDRVMALLTAIAGDLDGKRRRARRSPAADLDTLADVDPT